jgi:hypothetical protein
MLELPFQRGKLRNNTLTDAHDNVELVSHYREQGRSLAKNILDSKAPINAGEKRRSVTSILDSEQNLHAEFYSIRHETGKVDREIIECFGEVITGYDHAAGKSRCISLYLNDIQIGQIVKPLDIVNNLDFYYIFLLDEYSRFARILAFFTVCFDSKYYSRHGEVFIGKKYMQSYTFGGDDKNYNKNYNESWIRDNFDLERVAPEYIAYDAMNQKSMANVDRNMTLVFLMMLGVMAILTAAFALFGAFSDTPALWLLFIFFYGVIISVFIVYKKMRRKQGQ